MSTQNYIDDWAEAIHNASPPERDEWDWRQLYRYYAVLLLAKGDAVTDRDVHNAWAAWAAENRPDHSNLVPFGVLSKSIQDLDKPYTEAIREVARMVRDQFPLW